MGQQLSSKANFKGIEADVGAAATPSRTRFRFKLKRLTDRPKPSPSPSPSPERRHILSLPGEVRNQIYSYILSFPYPLVVYRVSPDRIFNQHRERPDPYRPYHLDTLLASLFLTNKQISQEAQTYFYSNNVFSVPNPSHWPPNWAILPVMQRGFIDRIGRHNACALRHLKMVFPLGSANYVQWARLDALSWDAIDGRRRPLFPGLAEACPNLAVLEFEVRSSTLFVSYLMPSLPDHRRRTMVAISQQLREEFPGLQELVIDLYEDDWLGVSFSGVGGSALVPAMADLGFGMFPTEEIAAAEALARIRELGWGWTIRSAGPRHASAISYIAEDWCGPADLDEDGQPAHRGVPYNPVDVWRRAG